MFIFHASHILWSQTYCVSLILFRCKNQSTEAIFRPCRSRLPTAMEVAAEAKQETLYLTQKTQWLAVFSKSRNRMTCASHGFWGPLPQQMSQPCHWKLKLRTRLEEHCVWWHQTIFHHEWSELQAWLSSCIADVLHDVWHVLIRYAVLTTVFGLVALKHQPTSASTQCMSLRPAAVDAPAALAEAVHLTQFTLCFEQLDHVCSALCTMHFHLQTFLTVSCSPFMHHKSFMLSFHLSICFGSSINQFLQVCPHGSWGLLPMRMRRKHQWKLRIWLRYHYCWWHQIWFLAVWIISFLWAQA